nr:PEP-CTERM sorting domain-containing protein [Desulfobacula sp.]
MTLILFLFLFTSMAQAAILNFEDLYHDDDVFAEHGYSYTMDGFLLTNTSAFPFASLGTEVYGYSGSTALLNDNYQGETILTRVDNGIFGLYSIALSELYPVDEDPIEDSVLFRGLLADNSVVSQTFTLDGLTGAETFFFSPDFAQVVSVSWLQSEYFHQFDNIQAVPVPESSSLLLIGLGLMVAIGYRRRFESRS